MTGYNEYRDDKLKTIEHFTSLHPQINGFCNYIKTNKALTSVYTYICIINNFLERCDKKQNELTFDDFAWFMAISTREDGTPLTNSFQIQKYHALKNYSNYLYATDQISKDYMQLITRPKSIESQATIEKREKSYLNKKEIKKYVQTLKEGVGSNRAKKFQETMKERDYAIIMIFLTTGIRASAMVKIDIENIDFENAILRVTDKGSKIHTYNLNEVTMEVIKEWLKKRKVLFPDANTNALFLTKYGLRLKYDGISEIVTKYAVNIEGKHITPHKLRATYGTQLYEATKDIYFVQNAMGHSSPTTTERYVRGQKGITKQAADIMSKLI